MSDFHPSLRRRLAPWLLCCALTGCAVGPEFSKPAAPAPEDWTSWRAGDALLRGHYRAGEALPPEWWRVFNDPVLDRLEQRATDASPDLYAAALHYAQARVQRGIASSRLGIEASASGGIARERQSEYGAGTRLVDALGQDRKALAKVLSEPFTLYQAGVDASWEPDLWGRVRRTIEAADADVAGQDALLALARLNLRSDLASDYLALRTVQSRIKLMREEISVQRERLALLDARMRGGLIDHVDLERQRANLASADAALPPLLADEAAGADRIALLLGEHPGALVAELAPREEAEAATPLPELALGLPSEVALRRPDIRAAEARLRAATARIGIAHADLYPSIRLGAHLGYESYLSGEFKDWGSRAWSIGPSLSLPIFDHGRRKNVVLLRELGQQVAAINYHQTVRKAWQEIDVALNSYAADQQRFAELEMRQTAARAAYELTLARYRGGAVDYLSVLAGRYELLMARRDLFIGAGSSKQRFVAVNKAIGNID